jgi:ribosomal protein L11 methyltransferase
MSEKAQHIEAALELPAEWRELLIARLGELGYEAFEEREEGLGAWIEAGAFDEAALRQALEGLPEGGQGVSYSLIRHEARNWNAEWEAQYPPIELGGFCQVVPSFREGKPGFRHTLVIDPKMSFGTGHHETTRLMMQQMAQLDLAGKAVLDMGCGTGILGILAARMGAAQVWGIDIDAWSYENAGENLRLNGVENMTLIQGGAAAIPAQVFDVVLANINRNVLLADIPAYSRHLPEGGILLLSGFYIADEAALLASCAAEGLGLAQRMEEEQWSSLCLEKI